MPHKLLAVIISALAGALLVFCNRPGQKSSLPYTNLADSARYVGMAQCITCHPNVYNSFMQTGMGKSWDQATMQKSSARFDEHAYVYDSIKNFWYHPFWKDSSLYIREFRLDGNDTVYSRTELISFIVGSGQHTNSHIWQVNGFLYQAPLTFYTQKGIWDLPPGFDEGQNSRWSRIISVECMNCHNMYPQFESASENKFISVKSGIECERCHGPGSIHIREKMAGMIVDTSEEIDYSIVNPRDLPRDLQVELCQRCHLQGISVLNEGKTFFDFKPGMKLNEVMNVFMPRYEGNPDKFIMASHADRMKQSRCYLNSNMTCLTCHNPHVSVKVTPPEKFNNACRSCHNEEHGGKTCTLPMVEREKANVHCYQCHMPVSGTLDIPHVTVHDHRIQIPVAKSKQDSILKFVGLECMTEKNPPALLMAKGYLQTYEAYSPQPFLLDSAEKYLLLIRKNSSGATQVKIRWAFLKKDYATVVALAQANGNETAYDAWTNYRIGESCLQTGNSSGALKYFKYAVSGENLNPEFMNKLGTAYLTAGELDSAEKIFVKCMVENPKYAPALNNLGYVYLLKNDMTRSGILFEQAVALDPDYVSALMNKAQWLLLKNQKPEAEKILKRVLQLEPQNEKAAAALSRLEAG